MQSEILNNLVLFAQSSDALLAGNADQAGRGYFNWDSSFFWLTVVGATFLFTVIFLYRLVQQYRSNFR